MRRAIPFLLLAILPVLAAGCAAPAKAENFPSFVYGSSGSLDSYRLATRSEALLEKLPCYCGCAKASNPPHRNLKECFIRPDGDYEAHGSTCDLCGKIVVTAVDLQGQGLAPREIRAKLDAIYLEYGDPTDTPWPE